MQQIEKQLNKKLDVIKVKTFEESEMCFPEASHDAAEIQQHQQKRHRGELCHDRCADRGHVHHIFPDPAVRHAGESRPLYPDDDTVRYQRAGKNRYSGAAQVYRLKNNKNHKENPIDRNVSAVYGVLFSGLFTSQRRL